MGQHTTPHTEILAAAPGGRVAIDVTTALDSEGPAHGITRLIAQTAGALAAQSRVVFCRYRPDTRRFHVLDIDPARLRERLQTGGAAKPVEIVLPAGPVQAEPHQPPGMTARLYYALPRDARFALRRGLRHASGLAREGIWTAQALLRRNDTAFRRAGGRVGAPLELGPGDVLVQTGALWGNPGIEAELARHRAAGARLVTLLCDLIPLRLPQFFEPPFTRRFAAWFAATMAQSTLVVAISETTRRDAIAETAERGLPCPPIAVLRLGDDGLGAAAATVAPDLAVLAERPFVLCVGTIEIRKNHRLLYQVWRRLVLQDAAAAPRLVIAGQRGWLADETYHLLLRDPVLRDHVAILHGASDAEVAWLLARALFTVYPSFYEGWGLPVGESLANGRIAVTSDCPAVVEAGQGLALTVPPDDVAAWAGLVGALAGDTGRRARCEADIARDFRRVAWAQTTEDLSSLVLSQGQREAKRS